MLGRPSSCTPYSTTCSHRNRSFKTIYSVSIYSSTAHAQTYLSISVSIMVRKLAVSRLVRGKVAQAVPFRGGFAVVAGVAMFCVCVFSHFPAFFWHRRRSKQKLTKKSYFPVYLLATLYDTLLCATSEPNISSFSIGIRCQMSISWVSILNRKLTKIYCIQFLKSDEKLSKIYQWVSIARVSKTACSTVRVWNIGAGSGSSFINMR